MRYITIPSGNIIAPEPNGEGWASYTRRPDGKLVCRISIGTVATREAAERALDEWAVPHVRKGKMRREE